MTETEGIRKNKKYLDIKELVLYENSYEKYAKRWNNYNSSTFIYVSIKAYVSNYVRKGLKVSTITTNTTGLLIVYLLLPYVNISRNEIPLWIFTHIYAYSFG